MSNYSGHIRAVEPTGAGPFRIRPAEKILDSQKGQSSKVTHRYHSENRGKDKT